MRPSWIFRAAAPRGCGVQRRGATGDALLFRRGDGGMRAADERLRRKAEFADAYPALQGIATLLVTESRLAAQRGDYDTVERVLLRELSNTLPLCRDDPAGLAEHMVHEGFAQREAHLAESWGSAKRVLSVFWKCGVPAPLPLYRILVNNFREVKDWHRTEALCSLMEEFDGHTDDGLVIKCTAARLADSGDIAGIVDILKRYGCHDPAATQPVYVLRRIASLKSSLHVALAQHPQTITNMKDVGAVLTLTHILSERLRVIRRVSQTGAEPPAILRQNISDSASIVQKLLKRCGGARAAAEVRALQQLAANAAGHVDSRGEAAGS